ncbi:protein FAM171B isoform X2 [Cyprinus carpio]|uniref:Protein FAM171B isoform X2 n=1 Tax=Cyprinus carpio TaxID=7962 RepID=A0A9Q9Y6D4_CYPCA|nr:protein FAM171B isoform X2 [Cyprinus carpio]
MPELSGCLLLAALLIFCEDGYVRRAEGGVLSQGLASLSEVDNASDTQTSTLKGQWDAKGPPSESLLTLKIWVKDASSQRFLKGALVGVFLNGSQIHSSQTLENGEVTVNVSYHLGLTLTLVASMEGYVLTQLPWKTTKMPIFSVITMSLRPQTQGNIWLFDDTVLITRKASDLSFQPSVQFPKSLLKLSENTTISMLSAYLTAPALPTEKDSNIFTQNLSGKGGYRNVKLNPLAMISAQLVSNGKEVDVKGPIQLKVPLPYHTHIRPSDSLPAWTFDMTIGYMGLASSMDFMSYHTYLLVGVLGGTLVIVIGFLSVIVFHCRDLNYEAGRKRWNSTRLTVLKKDQTTSTSSDEVQELFFHNGDRSYSLAARGISHDTSDSPRHQANYNIYVENVGLSAGNLYENIGVVGLESFRAQVSNLYVNSDEVAKLREKSEQNGSRQNGSENAVFKDKLFHIYNQSMAIVPAPELFSSQGQTDPSGSRSATFPRNGMEHGAQTERNLKDNFTQTLPKVPPQDSDEQQALEGAQAAAANPRLWGRYSHLLESVSVPGTLNEAARMGPFRGELQGISEQTLLELSKGKPSIHPPRAWFVSLDGKPAAQVRHSVIELQGRHRPGSSNDTSLDSGVDMNELQQPLRKSEEPSSASMAKLSRNQEQDLSSSEIGSPEDMSLRNTLEGSSAAIPNIPEDRDAGDTSSESKSTPPPRRLRRVRDKKPDKKTSRHMREERPQTKQ